MTARHLGVPFLPTLLVGISLFFSCFCVFLALAHKLEPVGSAVLLVEPGLAVSEATGYAALALGRVGAVEERNVLIANVAEPREYC